MLKLKQLAASLARLPLLVLVILAACAGAAIAQSSSVMPVSSTAVTIPWGDVIGQLGVDLLPWAGLLLLGIVIKILPAPVKTFLTQQRIDQVDQLLERALGFAAANLQSQLAGKEISIDLKNQLVAQAAQYAIDHGSKTILDFIGGQSAVNEKLAARVLTSPAVQTAQTGPMPPVANAAPV